MSNFDLPLSDADFEKEEEERRAKIIPLKTEEVTEEEIAEAFEEMFQEEWRKEHE